MQHAAFSREPVLFLPQYHLGPPPRLRSHWPYSYVHHCQFSTASPDIDEKAIRDPDPRKMCAEIARAKARALVESLDKPGILITADQVRCAREVWRNGHCRAVARV